MSRIAIRRILVDGQAARRDVGQQLAARERQQRPHQPTATARGNSCETGGSTAAQPAQQDGLDLIVFVMRRHDVFGTAAFLHFTKPGIPHAPCFGLRRVGTEVQLGGLEWQSVFLCECFDRPSNRLTVRRDSVVHVGNDESESELRGHPVQQIKQRD